MAQSPDGHVRLMGRVQSLPDLCRLLERNLGRPVVDRTGLTKTYDFELDFTSEANVPAASPGAASGSKPIQLDNRSPGLMTALQEQLGLKLESTKSQFEILVIDHVERPSEN